MGVTEALTFNGDTSVRVSENTVFYNKDGERQGRTRESYIFNVDRAESITINGQSVACYRYFDEYTRESKYFPIETQQLEEENATRTEAEQALLELRQNMILNIPEGGAFCKVTARSLRVRDSEGNPTGRLILKDTIIEVEPVRKQFTVNGALKEFIRIKNENTFVAAEHLELTTNFLPPKPVIGIFPQIRNIITQAANTVEDYISNPQTNSAETTSRPIIQVETNGGRLNMRDAQNNIIGKVENGSMLTPALNQAEIQLNNQTYIPVMYNNKVVYIAKDYTKTTVV